MTKITLKTKMSLETKEAPDAVALMLENNKSICLELAARLRASPPKFVVTCARGSSDHAASYAKYLIESELGIICASAAPSIASVYGVKVKMDGALFIAISQSGQSPDLLATTKFAKDAGALVVAIVNVEVSPLAAMADIILPLCAGDEKSVAATKSYITSLAAIGQMVANWSNDKKILQELDKLPKQLDKAILCDWSDAVDDIVKSEHLLVIGRGVGFAIAQEAALKFKETCGLHAEAFSAAEIRHGPMAILKNKITTLVFSQNDQTQPDIIDLLSLLKEQKAPVYSVGIDASPATELTNIKDVYHKFAPIIMVQSFYIMVNNIALLKGLNPDEPPLLRKVTETK